MILKQAPKLMGIFVPGAVGAGGTPTMYYFFGGREIKELIKKYGEIVKFGDLTAQSGWIYTTPIGVKWADVCGFGNSDERDGCEEISGQYEGTGRQFIWLKENRVEGGSEVSNRKAAKQEESDTMNRLFNGIKIIKGRRSFDSQFEVIKKSIDEGINGSRINKQRRCFLTDGEGIVFNGFENGKTTCLNRIDSRTEPARVLFEKTAWLIASNAMSVMDSALRLSRFKNDLAIRFVDRDNRIKEIFRLGWGAGVRQDKKQRESGDGLTVMGNGIEGFGAAHRAEDQKLRGRDKSRVGAFGWDPGTNEKKKIAFK